MHDLPQLLGDATRCFNSGNLPQAELISRLVLRDHGPQAHAYAVLGAIANAVGMPEFAEDYFRRALQLDAGNKLLQQQLEVAVGLRTRKSTGSGAGTARRRYLLIKAWGFGFWSDVDHVLGQLLIAELTGRIPIVHWGVNSLFRDEGCDNAFESFFEPVSDCGIEALQQHGLSYFPPKWNRDNLAAKQVNKWQGDFSRMAGVYFLGRGEDVVVSDFHTAVKNILPWIPAGHPLHGLELQEVYRRLFTRYIRLKPEIAAQHQAFRDQHMRKRPLLAVHVRGSDKVAEHDELDKVNATYHEHIEKYLAENPDLKIFLLTDSSTVLEDYQRRYKNKLIYTDCARTADNTGVHYQSHASRRQVGLEVIRDVYLASDCDFFLGNGRSNVSTTLLHLKHWQPEQVTLLAGNRLYDDNFFLHRRK